MHLQSGENGHLRFQHPGHTGFRPKLKPCCRGIPLSHLRARRGFLSPRQQASLSERTLVLPSHRGALAPHADRVRCETWVSPCNLTTNGLSLSRKAATEVENRKELIAVRITWC